MWLVDRLLPYARNARTHTDAQVAQVAASMKEFGWTNPILVAGDGTIIAGHARLLAAKKLGMAEVPVIVLDHLSETQRRALILADNKLALNAGWDESMLKAELATFEENGFALDVVGFSDEELNALLAADEPAADAAAPEETVPEAPAQPVTQAGDVWIIGPHRLICGDCRELAVLSKVLDPEKKDARQVQMAITSPPYASQREYDASSGFKPVPPDEYAGWFRAVADNIAAMLVDDGSYFLNIKEHAEDGERSLYVKDLVLAHRRQWGWRFVDEFCWRKTDNGVPGGWNNRFKNAWEPVFHFARQGEIKFRPFAVGHKSDDCFDYSPNNPKSTSGSGLLGTGARGAAADGGKNQDAWERSRSSLASDSEGRHEGIARPSNVIEAKSESGQGSHSAPFPRALVEFFVLAFTDEGDVVFDPFMGSGTTMAAAHIHGRVGYGSEISPAYCDVILRRVWNLTGLAPVLVGTGETFMAVASSRGVNVDEVTNPKQQDSRAIKHNGPRPFYGPKKQAGASSRAA